MQIVNSFCVMQRASVAAEVFYAKGQYQAMSKMLEQVKVAADDIVKKINGVDNEQKEKPHDETNQGRSEDAPQQSRDGTKPKGRVNKRRPIKSR